MAKRLNPSKVRSALTYETDELAKTLGVTPATIRNMVKRGMPVMASQKPHLFSGLLAREFIVAENQQSKSPMDSDQLRCMSCRTGRSPLDMAVNLKSLTPKTALLLGVCEVCGKTCTRMISLARLAEFAETFDIKVQAADGA